jgi:sugar/nucleoside kinase (ribokinase family)
MNRPPRISCLGLASWDDLLVVDRYPDRGDCAIVDRSASLPGGTTTNTAVALARLGAQVRLAAIVGDDPQGATLRDALAAAGVDVGWVETRPGEPTDRALVVVSHDPVDRTIYWTKGARIARGDAIDIDAVFGADVFFLDCDDMPLRRFLTDLPAHTRPNARLLGALSYLADPAIPDRLEITLRHDAIVGNVDEAQAVTGTDSLDAALALLQRDMVGANLRAAIVSRGALGAIAVTRNERFEVPAFPIDVVDTTGAGDAFAAGIAWGMAHRWPWTDTLRLANAVGALSTRALGGQAALPSLADAVALAGPLPD